MPELGIYHLADRPDLYEPMRDNHFEFIVHDIDNLLRAGVSTTDDSDYVTGGQEVLRFSVNKVNIPNFTQQAISIKRGNTTMKAAGTIEFGDGEIEIVDYVGADSKSVLLAWQRLSGDVVTEAVGRMADYKKRCTLIEYTCDFKQVRYWDIYGAWVGSVRDNGLSNEGGNDKRVMTATLYFDKAVPHLPDDEA